MLTPNDLPLVCLPVDLSDESAAKLIEFLHEFTESLERHYYAQLTRYYSATDSAQHDLDPSDPPVLTDCPARPESCDLTHKLTLPSLRADHQFAPSTKMTRRPNPANWSKSMSTDGSTRRSRSNDMFSSDQPTVDCYESLRS